MNNQVKMDMRTAVIFAEGKIAAGKCGFFLNTEFGKIGIEVNGLLCPSPLHPVVVLPWEQAPSTSWCLSNVDKNVDYYVSIEVYESELSNHIAIIEALTRCMFMNCGYPDIEDDIIDAAITIYITNYDGKKLTINSLENEFCQVHLNIFARNMVIVQNVVHELFQKRMDMANRIITESKDILNDRQRNNNIQGEFYDTYCSDLFGIVLYVKREREKAFQKSLDIINNFELSNRVNKPNRISTSMNI